MRTTSSVESLNAVFGRKFPIHPNIFDFIENLRLFEFSMVDVMMNLADGDEGQRMTREKDRVRDGKINRHSQQLSHGIISFKQFLNHLATENERGSESESSDYESDVISITSDSA